MKDQALEDIQGEECSGQWEQYVQMSWGKSILDVLEESHGGQQSGAGAHVGESSRWQIRAVSAGAAWAVVKISAFLHQRIWNNRVTHS